MFQACYSNTKHRLTDQSNRLLTATTNTLSQNVYAEVSILPSVSGEPWQVQQVQQVHIIGGNIKTCFFELHANHYRAAGENPSWIADVRDDGIYIRGAYGLQQLVFPLMETLETANAIEWTSQIKAASTYHVNLLLTHEPCEDRYGVEYEFQARLKLNDDIYTGCAREGNLGERTIVGEYVDQYPNPETSQKAELDGHGVGQASNTPQISLTLLPDKTVTFKRQMLASADSEDSTENAEQLVTVKTGTWQLLENNKLVVYLATDTTRGNNEVLLFERPKRGGLVLQGYHEKYGAKGLTLWRAQPYLMPQAAKPVLEGSQ